MIPGMQPPPQLGGGIGAQMLGGAGGGGLDLSALIAQYFAGQQQPGGGMTPTPAPGAGIQPIVLPNKPQQKAINPMLEQIMLRMRHGGGGGTAADPNPVTANRPFGDLVNILGGMFNPFSGWGTPTRSGAQGPAGGGFAGATDRSGQVRGGGTGHVGGGLTQGGPR